MSDCPASCGLKAEQRAEGAFVPAVPLSSMSFSSSSICARSPLVVRRNGFRSRSRSRTRSSEIGLGQNPPRMSVVFQHAHALAEMANQLIISCGVGLAGLVGGKATEQVRALSEADRRADMMDRLSGDIDSYRRRKELASAPREERDWSDVAVDKLANHIVVQEDVPLLGGSVSEELDRFDSLLLGDRKKRLASRVSNTGSDSDSTTGERKAKGNANGTANANGIDRKWNRRTTDQRQLGAFMAAEFLELEDEEDEQQA